MKAAHASSALLNLDVLALSLLCCLLASVVGVLVLGGEASPNPPQENAANQDTALVWTRLHEQTANLYARVEKLEQSRETITSKLNYSLLERANRDLESRIKEIQETLNLVAKIQAAKHEIAQLRKELEDEEKKQNIVVTPEAKRMLGEYKGPYVLIECVENGAIVYPGQNRIEMSPSVDQADQLLNQITNAGFVAFVVRPAGWYDNSFDKIRKLVYERLDRVEKGTGRYIGRSTFPLAFDDLITDYIPSEAKQ